MSKANFLVSAIAVFLVFGTLPACAQAIDAALLGRYDTALVVYNRATGETISIDTGRAGVRHPPCSTFKIYNTLIGLETGLLKGADDPWYTWDGVRRDIEAWNRNLTLREAFRVSAVPAYQILARQIGARRMKEYIGKIGYGSQDISSGVDTFWLPRPHASSVMISADEQVALLNKLLDGELPFSGKNIAVIKDLMRFEQSETGTLYGKTGSGTRGDGTGDVGWYVGFLESGGITYVFACNITGGENPSGKIAQGIVLDFFRAKGLF